VIPAYWPTFHHGGPIFSVHNLNKTLAKKGINVSVYTSNLGLVDKVPTNQEINIDGVEVIYFGFTKLLDFIATPGWQFSLQMSEALKNNLKAFDLIYIINIWSYPATIAAYYSRLYKKPYILVPSGMLYPDTFYKKRWKKWLYYHLVVKKDLRGASAIHYTAEDEAEKTHSFLGLKNRTIIVPNGIDFSEFSNLVDREKLKMYYPYLKDKKIILFLGRIHWIKGLDILIKAYARLVKDRDDVHLLVVGNDEGGYIKKVKRWIREYGMDYVDYNSTDKDYTEDTKVTFTGMLTGKEKIEIYKGSDIFVLPSYSENFGMVVVEAMACGLPVVISDRVGIAKKIEQNNAGIIIDTNTEDLYRGIKLLLDNSALKKEIAVNGRKLAQDYYDIDKVADKMIKAYHEILSSRR
jgi:glycosyltransferase involved in cell wall biosynthesis